MNGKARINLTATYQLTDVETAVRAVKDPLDHLYKEVQFGLRGAVGTRTLDALLEDKESNAVALRLKELETLEKVIEKIGTISPVYGGFDAVLNDLVRMKQ
jgi:regulator of protease activity HflC (stomatin/prohibitin superfamily)